MFVSPALGSSTSRRDKAISASLCVSRSVSERLTKLYAANHKSSNATNATSGRCFLFSNHGSFFSAKHNSAHSSRLFAKKAKDESGSDDDIFASSSSEEGQELDGNGGSPWADFGMSQESKDVDFLDLDVNFSGMRVVRASEVDDYLQGIMPDKSKANAFDEDDSALDLATLDSKARKGDDFWKNIIDIRYEAVQPKLPLAAQEPEELVENGDREEREEEEEEQEREGEGESEIIIEGKRDDKVVVERDQAIFSTLGFEALLMDDAIVRNLRMDLGMEKATVIQEAVIPRIVNGDDVVFQSHTGSGKTFAFVLPIMEQIDAETDQLQSLILAPTRELAVQIADDIRKVSDETGIRVMAIIGGANYSRQEEKLKKNKPHIVVGTPGRLKELTMGKKSPLQLSEVTTVVVDEVDHCIRQPFREELDAVLKRCPRSRQLIFSSATSDDIDVKEYAKKWMKHPTLVRVHSEHRLPPHIKHYFTVSEKRKALDAMRRSLFTDPVPESAVCFVDDTHRVDIVWQKALDFGIQAVPLKGDADKVERENVLRAFKKGDFRLLVATEVAARGLDMPSVSMVINLDLPSDSDHYIHRAGRCGRAGRPGRVISIVPSETQFVMEKFARELGIEIKSVALRQGDLVPFQKSDIVRKDKSKDSEYEEPKRGKSGLEKNRLIAVKNKGKPDFAERSPSNNNDDKPRRALSSPGRGEFKTQEDRFAKNPAAVGGRRNDTRMWSDKDEEYAEKDMGRFMSTSPPRKGVDNFRSKWTSASSVNEPARDREFPKAELKQRQERGQTRASAARVSREPPFEQQERSSRPASRGLADESVDNAESIVPEKDYEPENDSPTAYKQVLMKRWQDAAASGLLDDEFDGDADTPQPTGSFTKAKSDSEEVVAKKKRERVAKAPTAATGSLRSAKKAKERESKAKDQDSFVDEMDDVRGDNGNDDGNENDQAPKERKTRASKKDTTLTTKAPRKSARAKSMSSRAASEGWVGNR